jgi:hypothetical protein
MTHLEHVGRETVTAEQEDCPRAARIMQEIAASADRRQTISAEHSHVTTFSYVEKMASQQAAHALLRKFVLGDHARQTAMAV